MRGSHIEFCRGCFPDFQYVFFRDGYFVIVYKDEKTNEVEERILTKAKFIEEYQGRENNCGCFKDIEEYFKAHPEIEVKED